VHDPVAARLQRGQQQRQRVGGLLLRVVQQQDAAAGGGEAFGHPVGASARSRSSGSPFMKKVARTQCAFSACCTRGVVVGCGPSSKVMTTSPRAAASACAWCRACLVAGGGCAAGQRRALQRRAEPRAPRRHGVVTGAP
jgi:hypothetical protein